MPIRAPNLSLVYAAQAGAAQGPTRAEAQDPSLWQLDLLGRVRLRSGPTVVDHFHSRAVVMLLARLALFPRRAHAREELIELLWPGAAPDKGRPRLRQSLSVLRSVLQSVVGAWPDVLRADRQTVSLAEGAVRCDVLDFERLLVAGDTVAARAVYAGEFMPGHYDDWVVEERTRLQQLFETLPAYPRAAAASPQKAPPKTPQTPLQTPPQAPSRRARAPLATLPRSVRVQALPAYWTTAFGQEAQIVKLCDAVLSHRLVALLGPGGNGKTRLAVAVAAALAAARPARFDRVAFVSLIDCTSAAQFWDTLALTLGLGATGHAPGQVAAALAHQPSLLVLDNCEQLDEDAAQAMAELLAGQAPLHLLLTSRRRLGLPGELVVELGGLPLPGLEAAADEARVPALAANPAVALFVDRARASRADFQLKPHNAAAVAGLVRLLGGMPLAIELAASRLRALQPRELLRHLTQDAGSPSLDLLARPAAGSAGAPTASRHASMRQVVSWSWRQLSPSGKLLLRAMSVLAAPASVEVVAQVCAGLAEREGQACSVSCVQAWLADAHEASLVQVQMQEHPRAQRDTAGGATQGEERTRYALLQPVREFAAERVSQSEARQARARLRHWLLGFAQLQLRDAPRTIAEIDAEMPQIHASIAAAVADGASDEAAQLAVALRRHWEVDTRTPPPRAVVQALEEARPGLTATELQCETSLLLCFSCSLGGDTAAALAHGERALALAPDGRRRAQALMRLAAPTLFSDLDPTGVAASLAEAVDLARQAGDVETECLTMRMQFLLLSNRANDFIAAEALAGDVLSKWERLGHHRNATSARMDRASCWLSLGRVEAAFQALVACEQAARADGYATGYIMASWQLGLAAMQLHRADDALAAFQRCVRDAWAEQRLTYVADALVVAPGGLVISGRPQAAARLLGFAAPHWERHFGSFYRQLERHVRLTRRLLRSTLGAARLDALRLEGAGLSLPQAVALALDPGPEPEVSR